jgi:hypothetical protein
LPKKQRARLRVRRQLILAIIDHVSDIEIHPEIPEGEQEGRMGRELQRRLMIGKFTEISFDT